MITLIVMSLAQGDVDCTSCHRTQTEAHAVSIHKAKNISCSSCHGTDQLDFTRTQRPHQYTKDFNPGRDVPGLCMKCHEAEVGFLRESKHLDFEVKAGRRKLRNCIVCHEHHRTEEATYAKIENRCLQCHDPKEEQVATFGGLLKRARADVADLPSRVASFRAAPRVRASAVDLQELFAQMRRQQHSLKIADLGERERRALELLEIEESAVLRRPLWLAGFLFLVAVFSWRFVRGWRKKWTP